MCFKPSKGEGRARARERLGKVRAEDRTPTEVSRPPRGNREPDREEQRRAEERLLSVVGN